MTELVLYHNELSPCAHKVRLVLEEREIPFEARAINLMAKENLRPEYLEINPKGLVPALVHGENIVTESTVICEYLEDCFDNRPLMPADPMGKVRVRYWLKLVDEQLHTNTMPIVFGGLARFAWLARTPEERRTLLDQVPDANRRARQERLIEHGLDAPDVAPALAVWKQCFGRLEQQLSQTRWLAGDSFTMADCAVAPYMFIMKYLQVDAVFDRYPELGKWMSRLMARPAFEAAVMPYVEEQRWAMISKIAVTTGPALIEQFFSDDRIQAADSHSPGGQVGSAG